MTPDLPLSKSAQPSDVSTGLIGLCLLKLMHLSNKRNRQPRLYLGDLARHWVSNMSALIAFSCNVWPKLSIWAWLFHLILILKIQHRKGVWSYLRANKTRGTSQDVCATIKIFWRLAASWFCRVDGMDITEHKCIIWIWSHRLIYLTRAPFVHTF